MEGTLETGAGATDADRRGGAPGWVDDGRVRKVVETAGIALLLYWLLERLWPAPAGVIVQGMVIGGLTSLVALGLSLTYRANRIINFAQGDLGGVPGALAVLLIVQTGIPFVLAVPIGIAAAVALGSVVEFVVIRRFFKAPRLILTVVTIGLAQMLAFGELLLPHAFNLKNPPQSFPSPFDFSFRIHPIVFRGSHIIAMLAVPLAIAGLAAFFRFTNIGIAVRASAQSADRASLLGIPVRRIHNVVWIIATVLATLAVILRAGIVGLPIGASLGPAVLLRALAPAVLGRFERMPTIVLSSIAIGVVEQSVVWHGNSAQVELVLFLVVVGALLIQRGAKETRAEDMQASSWQAAREVRPIPTELKHLPEVRYARLGLVGAISLLLVAAPLYLSISRVNLLGVILIYGIIGLSLVVLTGWAGQVSLGQLALVAVGAAVGGWATSHAHLDLAVALVLSGLAGAGVALLIGLPAVRIRGLYLAVTTLAFAVAMSVWFLGAGAPSWMPTGRINRTPLFGRIQVASETRYYYLVLVGLAVAVTSVNALRNSRTGRVLIAVRENQRGAQAFGVSPTRAKLTAFALSGFLAAFAGGLFVHHQQGMGINPYAPAESLRVFTVVVVGGLGSVPGVLLGASVFKLLDYFRNGFPHAFRNLAELFTSGLGVILVLYLLPGGLGQLMYDLRDHYLRRVAARRDIVVPSLVADVRADSARPAAVVDGRTAAEPILVGGR